MTSNIPRTSINSYHNQHSLQIKTPSQINRQHICKEEDLLKTHAQDTQRHDKSKGK